MNKKFIETICYYILQHEDDSYRQFLELKGLDPSAPIARTDHIYGQALYILSELENLEASIERQEKENKKLDVYKNKWEEVDKNLAGVYDEKERD